MKDRKPETLLVGAGLGDWQIRMKRVMRPGLLRSVRYPRNDPNVGCVGIVPHQNDSVVDHYPGIRLAWIRGQSGALFLHGIATTRRGDRTIDGLSIGKAKLSDVRRRYREASFQQGDSLRPWGSDRIAYALLDVYVQTQYEGGYSLLFWFSREGLLAGLQTSSGGC